MSRTKMSKFQKDYIKGLKAYIETNHIGNIAIFAPTTDKDPIRVYSYGGRLADVRDTKVNYLNKDYIYQEEEGLYKEYYTKADIGDKETFLADYGSRKYEKCIDWKDSGFRTFFDNCMKITKCWSKDHEERRTENKIAALSRSSEQYAVIDIEFNVAQAGWKGKVKGDNKLRGGRIDLVVFDEQTRSIGFVELKKDCNSMANFGKHCADFEALLYDERGRKRYNEGLYKEVAKRLIWMKDHDIIPAFDITEKELLHQEKFWYGFLFVGGEKAQIVKGIENAENWRKDEYDGKVSTFKMDYLTDLKEGKGRALSEDVVFWDFEKTESVNLCRQEGSCYTQFKNA